MKTGVILYITGKEPDTFNYKTILPDRYDDMTADRVEVVSEKSGHYDIHNAWWRLQTSGVHRVVCRLAEFTPSGDVRLTGREMRLSG